MTLLVTLLLTLIIVALLLFLFIRLKSPYYRVDRARMIRELEMALTGQATENDWQMVFAMTIRHDPELEEIRQQVCEIEEKYSLSAASRTGYLFSTQGLSELKNVLHQLKNNRE